MLIDNTVYLFDNKKRVIGVMDPKKLTSNQQTNQVNSTITHEVEGTYVPEIDESAFFGMKDIEGEDNFLMYKIDKCTIEDSSFYIHGTHVFFDDLSGRGGLIMDRRPNRESVVTVLQSILSGTGWVIGHAETDNRITTNYHYAQKIDAFWDLLEKGNVEFTIKMSFEGRKIKTKTVNIYNEVSIDRGKWYEYGNKLLKIKKEVNTANIPTAFIGRGAQVEGDVGDGERRRVTFQNVEWSIANGDPVDKPMGQDYLEIVNATEKYGYEDGSPRYTMVELNDIDSPWDLLEETYKHAVANSRPKIHFETEVFDDTPCDLGEYVRVIRSDLNIRYKTRIFKLVRDFRNRKIKTIEFGDKLIYTQAERIREQQQEIANIADSIWVRDGIDGGGGDGQLSHIVVVPHGVVTDTPRPSWAHVVYWIGVSMPENAIDGDMWLNSAPNPDIGLGYVYVVSHGNTKDTPRPDFADVVYWHGQTRPTQARGADLWFGSTI